MAKAVSDVSVDLKKTLASGKLVMGADETIKLLRQGKLKRVFVASNCAPLVKSDLEQLCKTGNIDLVELGKSNEEIGILCKKPFAVSVVGVMA